MTQPQAVVNRLNTLWLKLNDVHAEPPATAHILDTLAAAKNAIESLVAQVEDADATMIYLADRFTFMNPSERAALAIRDSEIAKTK